MAEIMGRMAEQKQIAVQAAERKLCEKLNELAASLTAQADAANAARGLPITPRSARQAAECILKICRASRCTSGVE